MTSPNAIVDFSTGNPGLNAFSALVGGFIQPAVDATVNVVIKLGGWTILGQTIFIEVGGVYRVVGRTVNFDSSVTATLLNLGAAINAAPGTAIGPGSCAPSGESSSDTADLTPPGNLDMSAGVPATSAGDVSIAPTTHGGSGGNLILIPDQSNGTIGTVKIIGEVPSITLEAVGSNIVRNPQAGEGAYRVGSTSPSRPFFVDDSGVEYDMLAARPVGLWCAAENAGATGTKYLSINPAATAPVSTLAGNELPVKAGFLKGVVIAIKPALSTADLTFTVEINGADSTITGQILHGGTTLVIAGHFDAVNDGDWIGIKIVESSPETASTINIRGYIMYLGLGITLSGGSTPPPDIQINGTAAEGGSIDLTWVSPPGDTTSVAFKDGGSTINTDGAAPWVYTVTGLKAGTHAYHAVAAPDSTDSGTANVFVAPGPPIAVAPSVETVSIGTSISLDATTLDDSITSGVDAVITGPSFSTTIHLTLGAGHWTGSWSTAGRSSGVYSVVFTRHTSSGDASSAAIAITLSSAFTVVTDTFLANGTWTAPAQFQNLAGTTNHVRVSCYGNGGPGLIAVGGGGGGAYAEIDFTATPSTGYAIAGIAGGTGTSDGGDLTFNGTSCVAKGGQSRTNGGAGGSAAASTGTTKWDGGTGNAGSGTALGGGSAGRLSAASGVTGGQPGGVWGLVSTNACTPGGGGPSTGSTAQPGAPGMVQITYATFATAGFPCVKSEPAITRDTAAGTTRTANLPTSSGGIILIVVSGAGAATITMGGDWTALTQASNGANCEIAAFWAIDTGTLSTTITTSNSIRVVAEAWRITGPSGGVPGTPLWTTATGGANTSPNPPSSGTVPSADYLAIACASVKQANAMTTPTAPASYGSFRLYNMTAGSGPALLTAERYVNTTAEDPAAFGIGISEQWATATILIPPS